MTPDAPIPDPPRDDRPLAARLFRRGGLSEVLFERVDIASLVVFRFAFGAILVWEACRYFAYGWITEYYVVPDFHFTFFGFGWVQPWPGWGMYAHFVALGVLAAMIAFGLFYRAATVLFFLAFTYVFLLDQARYLNHFYLVSLIAFLLCWTPLHTAYSLDARRKPALRDATAPRWALWLLRGQLALVYFFAAVAKMNADWLRGEPMRGWMASRTDFPLIGPLFDEPWMVVLFSLGGLTLDLLAGPLLFWRRARPFVYAATVVFHLMNARLFSIGIFPWFMIAATTIFFEPDWPRRVLARLSKRWTALAEWAPPWVPAPPLRTPTRRTMRIGTALFVAWFAVQTLVPLRHWLYPGEVSWTEEGHRFAWHMMLRSKRAGVRFHLTDPRTGEEWTVYPDEFLEDFQDHKMETRPDMILQAAHYLAWRHTTPGSPPPIVRVEAEAGLNGRPRQPFIDPDVDLARVERSLAHAWDPLESTCRHASLSIL